MTTSMRGLKGKFRMILPGIARPIPQTLSLRSLRRPKRQVKAKANFGDALPDPACEAQCRPTGGICSTPFLCAVHGCRQQH